MLIDIFQAIICSALVLALCAMVESRGYGHSNSGCSGYNCGRGMARAPATHGGYGNNAAASSAYGPYHSYAVRPVVYGGHGMYSYRGYARHSPAPAHNAHLRYARSYPSNAGRCSGYNCRSSPAASHQQLRYGWRPVKALAIAPATYTDNYSAPAARGHGAYGRGMGAARGANYGRLGGSHGGAAMSAARYHRQSAGYNRAARHSSYAGNRNHGMGGY